MHANHPPPQLPITEGLSKSWPSPEIAAGRWLMSALYAFLKRPLTFSTMGTILRFCSASTHPNGTLSHTLTHLDTRRRARANSEV